MEKYFPSLSPLPFFDLQNLRNVLFTLNCLLGKFDECFNVDNNLMKINGLWRPVMNVAKALIALPIQQQITHTTATFYTTADYGALYFRWYRIEATQ